MSTQNLIVDYILQNFLFSDDRSLINPGDSFLEKGIIDSTGIMELIFFIEDQFGIKVLDEEMVPENLDSVNRIVSFIDKKKAG
ncbi:MAG: acyl carrier protein [Gammaproteobacteria bacterium]|nr:acyl carrier protein [Gammaproteobacteria bacterium]